MKSPLNVFLIVFIFVANTAIAEPPPIIDYESRFHPMIGKNGIVASQESHASKIGLQVLNNGGNESIQP